MKSRSFGSIIYAALTGYMHRTGMMAFAVAPVLDQAGHSALPESQRGWYVPDGTSFKLDLEKVEVEDTAGLKTALEKERNTNKQSKVLRDQALADALKPYEGIDPVRTKALLSKFDNEEEAALIAAGKVDEVIAKRMAKRDAELQKQVDAAKQQAETATGVAKKFQTRVLDNHIRAAAAKAGLHPVAVDDALLRARALFTLNDDGDAVQLGADGMPVLGKDGKSPFNPVEWLESMKESAPHWFPAGSSGGGAGGSGGSGAGGKTITRAAFEAMSPGQRAATVKTHVIVD